MHTRWTLTIPRTLNDGTPVAECDRYWVESRIADIAGGFTATAGKGVWCSESGKWYREPVTVYTFDVERAADDEVRQLAADIALLLDQEAVYVTHQAIETQLITAREPRQK